MLDVLKRLAVSAARKQIPYSATFDSITTIVACLMVRRCKGDDSCGMAVAVERLIAGAHLAAAIEIEEEQNIVH
jgi:hypothetical protein